MLSFRMANRKFFFLYVCLLSTSEVAQSCPTLCEPMDCSLPGSSVHGIFQARILEWVAISFSRNLPNPGIEPGLLHCTQTLLPSEPPGKSIFVFMCLDLI